MADELRYWVFAGEHYYPDGGADDLASRHHDLPGALDAALKASQDLHPHDSRWSHVYDTVEHRVVARYYEGEVDKFLEDLDGGDDYHGK
jgi:hypothetical protein